MQFIEKIVERNERMEEVRKSPVTSKPELVTKLRSLSEILGDPATLHAIADEALLEFIGDADVRIAFDAIRKA